MIYAGFDRAECPTLPMMGRLLAETNLVWAGYYLAAPSQSGKGWAGKRAQLVAMGWCLAPIFVGQQTQGPGSKVVTREQGWLDGSRACTDMRTEGFSPGSWVYLDLENGKPFTDGQHDYVAAWIDGVEAGGFRGGVYCSWTFAPEVAALRPKARIWAFRVPTTSQHPVSGKTFPTPDPKGASLVASIWQRAMAVTLTDFGGLFVDLDCSTMRDPGAPDAPALAQGKPIAPAKPIPLPLPPDMPAKPPTSAPVSLWARFVAWFGRLA